MGTLPQLGSSQGTPENRGLPAHAQGHCLSVPQLFPVYKDIEISSGLIGDYLLTKRRNPLRLAQIEWERIIKLPEMSALLPKPRMLAWPCGTKEAMKSRVCLWFFLPSFLLSVTLSLSSPSPSPSLPSLHPAPNTLLGDTAAASQPRSQDFLSLSQAQVPLLCSLLHPGSSPQKTSGLSR